MEIKTHYNEQKIKRLMGSNSIGDHLVMKYDVNHEIQSSNPSWIKPTKNRKIKILTKHKN